MPRVQCSSARRGVNGGAQSGPAAARIRAGVAAVARHRTQAIGPPPRPRARRLPAAPAHDGRGRGDPGPRREPDLHAARRPLVAEGTRFLGG